MVESSYDDGYYEGVDEGGDGLEVDLEVESVDLADMDPGFHPHRKQHYSRIKMVNDLLATVANQESLGENCSTGTDLKLGESVVNK